LVFKLTIFFIILLVFIVIMSLPNWIRDKLATFESKADFSLYCNLLIVALRG